MSLPDREPPRLPEQPVPLEQAWLNPALKQTARFLVHNGTPEQGAHAVIENIWNMQGYGIPRVTGQDLPIAITGKSRPTHLPELRLFVPEPSPVITEAERELIPDWALQRLDAPGASVKEEKTRLIQEDFDDDQKRTRDNTGRHIFVTPDGSTMHMITGGTVPEDEQTRSSVEITGVVLRYPAVSLTLVPETELAFEDEVRRQAQEAGEAFLGVCVYDLEAELHDMIADHSYDPFMDSPNMNTDGQPPRGYLGMPKEMPLRDMIARLKYGLFV